MDKGFETAASTQLDLHRCYQQWSNGRATDWTEQFCSSDRWHGSCWCCAGHTAVTPVMHWPLASASVRQPPIIGYFLFTAAYSAAKVHLAGGGGSGRSIAYVRVRVLSLPRGPCWTHHATISCICASTVFSLFFIMVSPFATNIYETYLASNFCITLRHLNP